MPQKIWVKIVKSSQPRGASPSSKLQLRLENSAYFIVFEQICGKLLRNFRKLLKFSKLSFLIKLLKILQLLGLAHEPSPLQRTYIIILIFPIARAKNENFVKILHFSEIFSIIFHIFNNSQANFRKIPKLQGLANSKICPNPPKTDPQTFGDPAHLKNPACIAEVGFLLSKITV